MSVPPPSSPLSIAKESMTMGKESGEKTFKLLALVMMASAGLTTLLHAAHMVWRDMVDTRRDREYGRRDGRPQPPPDLPEYESPTREVIPFRHEPTGTERRWTGKANQTRRTPEGEQQWTAYSDQQGHIRQR